MNYPITDPKGSLLKRALLANAAFSAVSGFLIVLLDGRLSALLGIVELQLWPIGVMLLGFAAYLVWFATRPTVNSGGAMSIILSDLAWVAGTVILLLGWNDLFSTAGVWLLGGIGVVVFLLAELQWLGLRRLRLAQT